MTVLTRTIGHSLHRPECVLATKSGDFFVSHYGHGICRILPDGQQRLLAPYTEIEGTPLVPNGIALRHDGSFLIANIGDAGGIFTLDAEEIRPAPVSETLPPVNFVCLDEEGRIWFSVSSTLSPRHLAYRRDVANGYVGLIENGRVRVVVDGLHYANEVRPDLENGWLYVSETIAQRVRRFPLNSNLEAGKPELVAQFPSGAFVDGILLDRDQQLIAVSIVSNEVFLVSEPGAPPQTLLVERNEDWVGEVETALDQGVMGRKHFDTAPTRQLRNVTSMAFHGDAMDQLILGSLLGRHLLSFDLGLRGREPVHWQVEVPVWGELRTQEGTAA